MWNKISIIAPVGYSLGIVEDKDGKVVFGLKPVGENWAHGIEPKSGINTIGDGCTRFTLIETTESSD